MKEIWKIINDTDNGFEISNNGQVKSLDRYITQYNRWGKPMKRFQKGRLIKQHISKDGYYRVYIIRNNKHITIATHLLVAEAFLEIPEELKHLKGTRYLQVNHKDENKLNNSVENLEYCTAKYNTNYGSCIERRIKKQSKKILQYTLDGEFVREWESTREAGRNGYQQICISKCCRGINKQHKGFIWKYKEDI